MFIYKDQGLLKSKKKRKEGKKLLWLSFYVCDFDEISNVKRVICYSILTFFFWLLQGIPKMAYTPVVFISMVVAILKVAMVIYYYQNDDYDYDCHYFYYYYYCCYDCQ